MARTVADRLGAARRRAGGDGATSLAVARAVMRVTKLLAAPPILMAPGVAWPVLRPGAT